MKQNEAIMKWLKWLTFIGWQLSAYQATRTHSGHTQPKMLEGHGLEPQLAPTGQRQCSSPQLCSHMRYCPGAILQGVRKWATLSGFRNSPGLRGSSPPPGANILCSNFKIRVLRVLTRDLPHYKLLPSGKTEVMAFHQVFVTPRPDAWYQSGSFLP